jgi:sortase A
MTTPAPLVAAAGTVVAEAPMTERAGAAPSPATSKPGRPWGPPQAIGVAVSTLAVLLVGFLCFLLVGSGIAEHRAQDNLYASFRGELSKAVAPTGPAAIGKPVALLEIPTLRIRDVVVEGTTSGALADGPGLRRDSVLPGQHGTSVIYGRRKAYGGPFSHVLSLKPGDEITTTTGLGVAHYRVTQLRDASSPFQVTPGVIPDQLILVTSDAPLAPTRTVLVVSRLVGKPSSAPDALPSISSAEAPLHGDRSAGLPLAWWSLALVIAVAAAGVAAVRWSKAGAYLLATPLVLAILWNVYESVGRLLPNTL